MFHLVCARTPARSRCVAAASSVRPEPGLMPRSNRILQISAKPNSVSLSRCGNCSFLDGGRVSVRVASERPSSPHSTLQPLKDPLPAFLKNEHASNRTPSHCFHWLGNLGKHQNAAGVSSAVPACLSVPWPASARGTAIARKQMPCLFRHDFVILSGGAQLLRWTSTLVDESLSGPSSFSLREFESCAMPDQQAGMKAHWKALAACTLISMSPFQYGVDFGIIGGLQAMVGFLQVSLFDAQVESSLSICLQVFGNKDPATPIGYNISAERQQLISSLMVLGAFLASGTAGFTAKWFGRKVSLYIACLGVVVSTIIMQLVESIGALYFARLLIGLANGLLMTHSQLYIQVCQPSYSKALHGSQLRLTME